MNMNLKEVGESDFEGTTATALPASAAPAAASGFLIQSSISIKGRRSVSIPLSSDDSNHNFLQRLDVSACY